MTTWADITAQLSSLMDDFLDPSATDSKLTYPEDLRMLAWNRAQEYFAVTHTALLSKIGVTPKTDGDGMSIDLPADWIQMAGLRIKTKQPLDALAPVVLIAQPIRGYVTPEIWLRPSQFVPGEFEDRTGYILMNDKIYFADPDINVGVLWYYAKYPDATGADREIIVPAWSQWAITNLAISNLLIPPAIGVADLRRFQTKREAGSPEDNPSRVQAIFHRKIYEDMVAKQPVAPRVLFYDSRR